MPYSSPYSYPEDAAYGSKATGSYLDHYRPAPMYRGGFSGYTGGYATERYASPAGYRSGRGYGFTSPSRVIDVHETNNFYKPGVYTEPRADGRSDLPPTEIVVHPPHGDEPPARIATSVVRPHAYARRTAPTYVQDYAPVTRAAPTYVQDYGAVRSAPTRYTSPTRSYGHTVPVTAYGVRHGGYGYASSSSPLALDAADGVIDGKYFGAKIAQPTRYSSSALALDAADGVIDGKYFGAPIARPTRYAPASSALALDAADGVIDGKYFGSPIVQPTSRYGPTSSALALDAADGVIDGKYYGSPIVQSGYGSYSSSTYARYGAGSYSDLPRSRAYNQGVY